jgi:hypothetical protein
MVAKTLALQLGVVKRVQLSVGGFLCNEIPHRLAQSIKPRSWGQFSRAFTHSFNEKLLSDRKTHGQRIHVSAAKRIAAVPMAVKALRQVNH